MPWVAKAIHDTQATTVLQSASKWTSEVQNLGCRLRWVRPRICDYLSRSVWSRKCVLSGCPTQQN